jgi:hypothetical protein
LMVDGQLMHVGRGSMLWFVRPPSISEWDDVAGNKPPVAVGGVLKHGT